MRTGLIAYKVGMTRIFENNRHIPVTILAIDNCRVISVMSKDKNGYSAVQLGAGTAKEKHLSKPVLGHLKKAGASSRALHEFRVSEDCAVPVGAELVPSHFVKGQYVDVQGRSVGKGFAGGMKRWNFRGMEASHGVSVSHRALGGTGQRQDPGKVFKGKKMPGHLGDETITVQNLLVVEANDEGGYLLVKGAVPGADGSVVYVKDAVKRELPKEAPKPAGIKASGAAAKAEKAEKAAEAPEATQASEETPVAAEAKEQG